MSGTGWIADNGGEVNHAFHSVHSLAHGRCVAHIAPPEFESGMRPDAEQGVASVNQRVQNADIMPALKQQRYQRAADIARPSGDQDAHQPILAT